MTAYELARHGKRVLVLERNPLPRYKPCAGGLTARVLSMLPFELDPVIEAEVTTLQLSMRSRLLSSFQRSYPQPFAYMVMRDRFDHYLVQRARDAGAEVEDGVAFEALQPDGAWIAVQAGGQWLAARAVVGADGALGPVARSVGLMRGARRFAALEAEVETNAEVLRAYRNTIGIEIDGQGGYGWVFPKTRHLSIGLEVLPHQRAVRRELSNYLARAGIDGRPTLTRGHPLCFRGAGHPIAAGQVLLAGEAAGLVDMFTGEGIYYALWSGRLAGRWLAQALDRGPVDGRLYQELVDATIMPELMNGRVFYSIFKLWPAFFFAVMRTSDRFWNAFCQLQRGKLSYSGVRRKLKAFEPLFKVVETFLLPT